MNWTVGLKLWWRGLLVAIIPCLFLLILGAYAWGIALVISWPAIAFYAAWLWVCKQSGFSHTATLVSTILIPAPISIVCALWLFNHFIDDELSFHISLYSAQFLGPLLCCLLSVFFSRESISLYLNPDEAITAFTID